jgi:hypothetical protein
MTTKAKCYELAKEHSIEIQIHINSGTIEVSLNLPEGYQLDIDDDRQGLVGMAESKKQLWVGVFQDLQEIISFKPWFEIKD